MRGAARVALWYRCKEPVPPEVLAGLRRQASAAATDETDFWQRVMALDARVLLAASDGGITPEEEADILREYDLAWRHLGSPIKLKSVLEQLEFLRDVLPQEAVAAAIGRIQEALETRLQAASGAA